MKSDNDENVIKLSSSPDSLLFSSPFSYIQLFHTHRCPPLSRGGKIKRRMRERKIRLKSFSFCSVSVSMWTHTRDSDSLSLTHNHPFCWLGCLHYSWLDDEIVSFSSFFSTFAFLLVCCSVHTVVTHSIPCLYRTDFIRVNERNIFFCKIKTDFSQRHRILIVQSEMSENYRKFCWENVAI